MCKVNPTTHVGSDLYMKFLTHTHHLVAKLLTCWHFDHGLFKKQMICFFFLKYGLVRKFGPTIIYVCMTTAHLIHS